MTVPKLSHPSSGMGGRGYVDLFRSGKILPSITTCIGALDKPGLVDWHVSQTAAYAVTHIDDLLNRTEEQGMRYLQYFSRRKPKDWDDPEVDVWNAAQYVLDDLSNTGDFIHNYIEQDLLGLFTDDPVRSDHLQMVEAWHVFKDQNEIEVITTESTVYGDGYAGTADLFALINGVVTCVDFKSSRKVHSSHVAQLSAIGAATLRAVEVSEGEGEYHKIVPSVGKFHGGQVDSWWREEVMPDFSQYAVIQIRPEDVDESTGEYLDPYCKMTVIPQGQIDAGYDLFRAGLDARTAERRMKEAVKLGT